MHHFPSEIHISVPAQQHGPARPGANGDCVDRLASRFRISNLDWNPLLGLRIVVDQRKNHILCGSCRCDFILFSRTSIVIGSLNVTILPSPPSLSPLVGLSFSPTRARISPSPFAFIKPSANQSLIPPQTESRALCGL